MVPLQHRRQAQGRAARAPLRKNPHPPSPPKAPPQHRAVGEARVRRLLLDERGGGSADIPARAPPARAQPHAYLARTRRTRPSGGSNRRSRCPPPWNGSAWGHPSQPMARLEQGGATFPGMATSEAGQLRPGHPTRDRRLYPDARHVPDPARTILRAPRDNRVAVHARGSDLNLPREKARAVCALPGARPSRQEHDWVAWGAYPAAYSGTTPEGGDGAVPRPLGAHALLLAPPRNLRGGLSPGVAPAPRR
mmetsp:Transcript_26203/g.62560  ORF Transcript_26203/g.62560 Transcript_26203/m.62560 type:complete len:250 (-) Transcript_26203:662-1411(-)